MGKLINLTGQRFGRWVVISQAESSQESAMWNCICDCGKRVVVKSASLRSGCSKSCGCLKNELLAKEKPAKTHGMTGTAIHRIWKNMKKRCYNANVPEYKYYGGRGITVCDRWMKFENFYADMGNRPKGKSIDRIDNNGNYKPSNCRWATNKEQGRNTSVNRIITYKGESLCLIEWAEKLRLPCTTLFNRLKKHSTPIAFNL